MGTLVVLGAGRPGIGQAVAVRLAKDGHLVLGTSDPEYGGEVPAFQSANPSVRLTEVDHSDATSVTDYLGSVDGPIDGLVVAELFFYLEDPRAFDLDKWNRSLFVNLTLPKLAFHTLLPRFTEGASVTVVTSTEGFIGSFGAHAYAATKAAIHNVVKSLANVAGNGVRVNAVAAGWIGGVMNDEVFNMSRAITPLGRLGNADEIAAVVAFLASREASFVNGSVVSADGGYSGVDTISKFEFQREFDDS